MRLDFTFEPLIVLIGAQQVVVSQMPDYILLPPIKIE